MADNVALNPASGGATISTDEIAGGVQVQRVKLQTGTDGNAADVNASNPLPVSDNSGSLTVDSPQLPAELVSGRLSVDVGAAALPTGAATSANQTTEITSLQLIDDLPHAMNDPFSKSAAVGGQLDDTGTTAATENNVAPVRITAQRGFHVNLRNASGTELGVSGAPVRTDPTGTTTQPVSDAGASLTVDSAQLPAALVSGRLDVNVGALPGGFTGVTEDAVASADPTGGHLMARARTVPLSNEVPAADVVALNASRLGALYTTTPNSTTAGQLTATGSVTVETEGRGSIVVEIAGTWSATLVFEGTVDGASWFTLTGTLISSGATATGTSGGTNGQWLVPLGGIAQFRVRCSAYTSGTIFVNMSASVGGATSPRAVMKVDLSAASLTIPVQGNQAHDSAASSAGNPFQTGLEARSTNPTAVSDADTVRAIADLLGKQIILTGAPLGLYDSGRVTLANTTASDVLAAPGAGVRWVVTSIVVTNASSTKTKVEIRDGTTVKMQPQAGTDGGFSLSHPTCIFRATANTAVTAKCVTTGADVDVFISGYKETT